MSMVSSMSVPTIDLLVLLCLWYQLLIIHNSKFVELTFELTMQGCAGDEETNQGITINFIFRIIIQAFCGT